MKHWKSQFNNSTLKQGMEHVEKNRIVDIYRCETGIDGVVKDDYVYEVELMLDGDQLINMACTCEQADEGNTCSHMAALLYAYEQSHLINDYSATAKIEYTDDDVSNVIDHMNENELKSLLKEVAVRNEQTGFDVMIRKTGTLTKKMFLSLKDEIYEIQKRHQDRTGFIGWDHASAYGLDLRCFLDDYAYVMIQYGSNMMAFELICEVFLNISTCDMDDSSDEFGFVSERCYELWKMIVEQCSFEELNTIRKWFKTDREDEIVDYACDFLNEFLELELKDKHLLIETMILCDRQIQSAGKDTDCGRIYRGYGENNAILRRIETMRNLGCSEESIQRYMQNHRQFFVIREIEIQAAIKQNDDERLLELLMESKKLDSFYPNQMKKTTELLIDWYQRNHQIENLIKECRAFIMNYPQQNLDAVRLLKQYLNDKDWKCEFHTLRRLDTMKSVVFDFLMMEERYREVIDQSTSLNQLDRFNELLMKYEQEACCEKYAQFLNDDMEKAYGRSHYAGLVEYLVMLSKFEYGNVLVHQLARTWKMKYPRRHAMLQELVKAGF